MIKILFLLIMLFSISLSQNDTLTISAVGDIMIGTHYPQKILPSQEEIGKVKKIFSYLKNADVTFGNFEGVLLNQGNPKKNCNDMSKCFLFKTPTQYAPLFQEAGFDLMSLANNHSSDFGKKGRDTTQFYLTKNQIKTAGLINKPYTFFHTKGKKIAFVAFSPNDYNLSILDIKEAKRVISHLDSISDIVLVSFHGGAEGTKYQKVPKKNEYYYGENRGNVYQFSRAVIDAGADIVFGHGPHVTRAIDLYKNRFIAYSLGNFWTYGRFNLKGVNGFAPIVRITVTKDGTFLKGIITSIKQVGKGLPLYDAEEKALKKIIQLTNELTPTPKFIFNKNFFSPSQKH